MVETTVLYFSATVSFVFLCIGVIAGWTANEKIHEYMYASQQENVHPEMLDGDGQWINEELLSVRFIDDDEFDDE